MAENPVGSLGQLPDAGGSCVTVRAAVPLCPSLAAAMLVVPVSKAVASPLPVTVAIAGLPELQVTARPVRTFPFASLSVAANCCVPPSATLGLAGLTVTDATGAGAPAPVVPVATLDSAPNTALTPSVPRKATS